MSCQLETWMIPVLELKKKNTKKKRREAEKRLLILTRSAVGAAYQLSSISTCILSHIRAVMSNIYHKQQSLNGGLGKTARRETRLAFGL